MKSTIAAIATAAALAIATPTLAADAAGPADKKDGGSLSSGAKDAMPATKNTGENAPVGNDASSGASAGDSGQDVVPGTKKPASSDPKGVEQK